MLTDDHEHGIAPVARARQPAGTSAAGGTPIHFLMFNVDAPDGVSRAVLTLANHLALSHPVEVISLYRRHRGPAYEISERVRVTYLFDHPPLVRDRSDGVDTRADMPPATWWPPSRRAARSLLARRASHLSHGRGFPNLSLLTDLLLIRKLRSIRTGLLISTRPALHVVAARAVRPGVVTIGQDHLNYESRSAEQGSMSFIEEAAQRGLDAFVTLTPSDAADYSRLLAPYATRVVTIANPLPATTRPPGDHEGRVVAAAGRLVKRKGMGRLIRAFEPVARRHPRWELRIYGKGHLEPRLRRLIEELGLVGQVRLMGHTEDLLSAFDDAAVFASASRAEGFPMVMLEAMSTGLPLVSFDCPRGPSDIIGHGRNGLLVPDQDVCALSEALDSLVVDDDRRRALGAEAFRDADGYRVDKVAASWEDLFDELCSPVVSPGRGSAAPRPGAAIEPTPVRIEARGEGELVPGALRGAQQP